MGSINKGHHEESGGVLIFNGEIILLFCDAVHCEVDGLGSTTGKIYLTTHRVIFTSTPLKQNPNLKSFSAPFFAMFDLKLEQPVFGANYIKGKVRSEEAQKPPFAFKLRFNKGGAIEFGQAMAQAAKQAESVARQTNFQAPPPYTPSPAAQYYQAGDNVYQPSYPVGFTLPTQVFNQPPPAGFIYAMDAPPPYPGLTTVASQYTPVGIIPGVAPVPGAPGYIQAGPYQVQAPVFAQPMQPHIPVYPAQQPGYTPSMNLFTAGAATNGAAGGAPSAPAFDQPPSYSEATKKNN